MGIARRSIGAQRNPESERAILKAARDLIAEEGLAGFSIEAVARRARAGKPTIYRWWPNRTLLLLDVYAGLKDEVGGIDTGTLLGDIEGFLSVLMTFWRGGAGDVFRLVVAEAQSDEQAGGALHAFHLERWRRTSALFARAREGEVPLTDEQAGRVAELAFGYALSRLMLGRLDATESEIRAIAKMLAAVART